MMTSTVGSTSPVWIQSRKKPSKVSSITPTSLKSKAKRITSTLDTNFNSYDRTDPFFAFNALIKLLGSLTSRIGGCQYKLTPDEHKLSLHLLTIVEPFVGLAPSRRTITRQPTEVLDAIIFHVDSKRDLLSLALSCQRMHDVVFPRHFQYRNVRCKVSSISVWNHLMINRSLARNVRRLEILDERSMEPEIIPPGILMTDTDLESTDDELSLHDKQERYLVSALNKMTALSSFTWSCNHSPISIDNVWPTLLKCYSLRNVEINDNLVFSPKDSDIDPGNKKRRAAVLPEMKAVSLRSTPHAYGSTKHPSLSRISGILNHCPNLESLDIAYSQPRASGNSLGSRPAADELLLYSRWPHLTTLTLTNLRCSPTTGFDSASTFLFAHLNLEVLHLDIGVNVHTGQSSAPRLSLLPNSLPRLRELQASKEIANAVLECPSDSPRPLDTIKGFRLSGSQGSRDLDAIFLSNLRRCGKAIKRMELSGWNEMEDIRRLVESSPGLTWLDVGKKGGAQPRDKLTATNTVEWATLLSELPDLVAFHGVKLFYEVSPQAAAPTTTAMSTNISMTDRSRIRKNDEIASTLAWKCPKIRRLDHWEEGGGKVVVLVKDEEKTRWEARRVKT